MRLELCTHQVHGVVSASRTRLTDGVLEINLESVAASVLGDPRIAAAELDIARPGESVRIIPIHDVIEPRRKEKGMAVAYPGVAGRPTVAVGHGRTHRLSGVGVAECALLPGVAGDPTTPSQASFFLDMTGPAALEPHASLHLVCVRIVPADSLSIQERADAAWSVTLRVADVLADVTAETPPTEIEVFELTECDPEIPKVVLISHLRSPEHFGGSPYAFGTAVYGVTRLSSPWLLHPNEILDGAISRSTLSLSTWLQANNPVVRDLYKKHGDALAFCGVIVQRTRWTSEREKELTASQAAKYAEMLGADGALMVLDAGGNDFIEVALTLEACEAAGIKTVLLMPDEASNATHAPTGPRRAHAAGLATLLYVPDEADAIVTTGAPPFPEIPAPKRIIGFDQDIDGIPARAVTNGDRARPVFGQDDYLGWRKESAFDY